MRKIAKHISCLMLILAPLVLAGQELPSLGVAPESILFDNFGG